MMPSMRKKKEVGVLHHDARPGVDQEHEAAQGEVEHAAGGGQGDADGVQAPSAGSAAGDHGGAGHAVGLGDWKECQVLRPWNATSRFSSAGVMKNRPRPASCAGSSAR